MSYVAWVLVAVLCAAIASAGVAWRAASRAVRSRSAAALVLAATAVGLAVAGFVFFAQAMRHVGGTQEVGQGASAYRCAAWWEQVGSPHGQRDVGGGPAPACRAAATDAIPEIAAFSGGAGVVGAAASLAWLRFRWRRAPVVALTTRSPGHA